MPASASQIAAQALVQTTLENLKGQGLDTASLTVTLKAPGNDPNRPHRQNLIAVSGSLDAEGTVVVKGNATNRVNQPLPAAAQPVPVAPSA